MNNWNVIFVMSSLTMVIVIVVTSESIFATSNDNLLKAAMNKDTSAVQHALENGADVDARGDSGTTALMWAAHHGALEMAQLLLDYDATVNAKNTCGLTALMYSQTPEMTRMLLENKAELNARDKLGDTVLMWAVDMNIPEVTHILLERGIDVHARENCGDTALIKAIYWNALDIAELLLRRGAEVNSEGHHGNTALIVATSQNSINAVELLLEYNADVFAQSYSGDTALSIAKSAGNEEIVHLLQLTEQTLLQPIQSSNSPYDLYVLGNTSEGKRPEFASIIYQEILERFPQSELVNQVKEHLTQVRNRLSLPSTDNVEMEIKKRFIDMTCVTETNTQTVMLSGVEVYKLFFQVTYRCRGRTVPPGEPIFTCPEKECYATKEGWMSFERTAQDWKSRDVYFYP